MHSGQSQGPVNAFDSRNRDPRFRPKSFKLSPDFFGKLRLSHQNASSEDELDRGRPSDETPRTTRRVPSGAVGRGLENVAGDAVSFPLGLEDFDGQRGPVAFAGGL